MIPVPSETAPVVRRPFYRHLYFQVLIAIALGALIGHFWPDFGERLKPLGDGFIKLVKMVIAPVIFLTIVTGIAGMRDLGSVGRVAAKAFAYFLVFSTLALIIGLIIANVVRPGHGLNIDPATLNAGAVEQYAAAAHESTIVGFLMGVIPDTLVSAFSTGNILQVLFVSILFGVSLALIGDRAQPVLDLFETLSVAVFKLVAIVMKAAPIGAFGAFAFTIGAYGIASIANLAALIVTFYATAIIFVVGVLGLVGIANGFSILKLIRYLKEELLLVLGTSSSEAALPSLISKMERAGAAKSVVGLVVPTGYSFNLDGTNIYMTMAALFIAQALNIDLTIWQQITLLLVAMLSSKGAAGITGAGFITLAATLSVVAGRAGRRHGADPGHRPLHERVPGPDQLHRQRRGDHRGGPLGERAGSRRPDRSAERTTTTDRRRTRSSGRTRRRSGPRQGLRREDDKQQQTGPPT